jgi:glycosyltransferase involved in cell wall biosynthesis
LQRVPIPFLTASQTVSVVIPCYNGERFIADTLRSALAQTHAPVEILVIDDGSKDDSARLAESFGAPVRVIRQPNQGESVARNRGITEATGDWIAFLDADDAWMPEKIARQFAAMKPDDVASVTNVRFFGQADYDAPRWTLSPDQMCSIEYVCELNAFIPSTLIIRRDLEARFPVWTRYGEDYVFTLDVCRQGSVAFVDEPLTRYRIHAKGQSSHPETLVRQDRTIRRWLTDHTQDLGEARVAAIRHRQLELLIQRTRTARQARKLDVVKYVRDYVREFAGTDANVDAFLREPLYPRVVYSVVDLLDASAVGRRVFKRSRS